MTKTYSRKQDVVARSVAGAHLLVPVHACTRSVYTLNDTGRRLWDLLESPRTGDDLAAALAEQFGIPDETARNDVQAFLNDMLRMNLVVEQE